MNVMMPESSLVGLRLILENDFNDHHSPMSKFI